MKVLAVGAHPDDIELGCGATLAKVRAGGGSVTMLILTDGALGPTSLESRATEQAAAADSLGAEVIWAGLADGSLSHGPVLVRLIGDVIDQVVPELVLTHASNDSHQDHIAAAAATVAAARTHADVLHYESPSTLRFEPTVFADVDGFVDDKLAALHCHLSQVVGASRVDLEAVEAQLRFRGYQGRLRLAEAFEATRTTLRIPALDHRGAGDANTRIDLTDPVIDLRVETAQ